MNTLDDAYPPPVGELLKLGEPTLGTFEDYSRFGFTEEHFPLLVRMMNDTSFWDTVEDDSEEERPEVYAPIHAHRAIGTSGWPGALDALLDRMAGPAHDDEDDWFTDDLFRLIPPFGRAALDRLAQIAADPAVGAVAREDAAGLIARIGVAHPETRAECVEILRTRLRNFEPDAYALNGFLVSGLFDLKGVEAIEEIRAVYAADAVDLSICGDLWDVEAELGLRPPRPQTSRGFKPPKINVPRSGLNARERAEARKKKRKQAKKHR